MNNNSFVTEKTFDGMRKERAKDFDEIYVLDLGGNVRKNPKLSGTTHNVFGIQVGVSINVFVRLEKSKASIRKAKIFYHAVETDWRKEEKYSFLEAKAHIGGIKWKRLPPDEKGNWVTNDTDEEFESFLPIGSKEAKAGTSVPTIFRTYSLGVSTNRDSVVYEFNPKRLAARVERFADDYNAELSRWQKKGRPQDVDNFVNYEKVKWSRNLKRWFRQETELQFDGSRIRNSVYRPYTKLALYYARKFIDEVGTTESLFPSQKSEKENSAIVVNVSPERPFCVLICNSVPSKDVAGGFGSPSYCLPHFSYSVDGRQRRDNITQKATTLFRIFYADDAISRADIFHYVYAVLHHPSYRMRFAENLRRDLPRIPFVGVVIGEKSASFFPLAAVETMQGDGKPAHNPKASAKLFHAFAKIDSHRARHGSDDVRLPN